MSPLLCPIPGTPLLYQLMLLMCYSAVQFIKSSWYTNHNIQSLGGWPRTAGTWFWRRSKCMLFMQFHNIHSFSFHTHTHPHTHIFYVLWLHAILMTVIMLSFFLSKWQDIQIRGVNRDEKKIEMAKNYPNSKHFLTYSHSLRVCYVCMYCVF